MPTPLLYVKPTIRNFSPCDQGLNWLVDNKINNKWGQHLIQLLSSVTHTLDLLFQMTLLPPALLINPVITIGVNLKNHQWKRAIANTVTIPIKLVTAIINIPLYESKMVIKLGWSLTGANALVNCAKGKKQTNAFFLKRIFESELAKIYNVNQRESLGLNPKKVLYFKYTPKDYVNNTFIKNLNNSSNPAEDMKFLISKIDHTYSFAKIFRIRKLNGLYGAATGGKQGAKGELHIKL